MLIPFNRNGSPIPCPCNGCVEPKRRFNCHAMCKEYKKYKKDMEEYNRLKRLDDEKNYMTDTHKAWLQKKQKEKKRRR